MRQPADVPENFEGFKLIKRAFSNEYLTYRFKLIGMVALQSVEEELLLPTTLLVKCLVKIFEAVKFSINCCCIFFNPLDGSTCTTFIPTKLQPVYVADDLNELIHSLFTRVQERIDSFTQRGSNWSLLRIDFMDATIGKYIPDRGGCSIHKLPKELSNKKCLISPQTDTDCFMYSVLICLHKKDHPHRISQYADFIDNYDWTDVRGSVAVTDIVKFERRNRISVNVYSFSFESKVIVPLKVADIEQEKHVNLFLLNDHYYAISSLPRLFCGSGTKYRYVCHRCCSRFAKAEKLEEHKPDCYVNTAQTLRLPSKEKAVVKRKDFYKEIKFPFCIYADFETLSVSRNENIDTKDLEPCSYGYVIVDWEGKIIHQDFYLGQDAGKMFLKSITSAQPLMNDYLKRNSKPLSLSDAEEECFKAAKSCHICELPLGNEKAVRDHDHLTGKFRGAAHNKCNLYYKVPQQFPVVFHNLKGFDGHIIINSLDKTICERNPKIIAQSSEKYIGILFNNFKIIDSLSFLPSSLDNLASNLTVQQKDVFLKQIYPDDTTLLHKKGSLPYEYLTSLDKFNDDLPDKSQFYSSLSESEITQEMYDHVKSVWSSYNCSKLSDLHDIYLKVDVLLLASVFENFRHTSLENFGIDPLHHFSTPGLTWAGALKRTKAEVQLFTDVDMLLMIEKGIRGGLTMVTNRHIIANNPNVPSHDITKETTHLLYLDVNNLYGYAMSQKLPIDGYEWCKVTPDLLDNILDANIDGDIGYILEVDMDYPLHLHNDHNDFPMAPHKMMVEDKLYSPYQHQLIAELKQKGIKTLKSEKLVTTFFPKVKYVVHFATLQFYVKQGMDVRRVHRAIKFRQASWLKDYVDFCTTQRQAATSDFDKDFWKLMVNSIYGKTIEDKRKHSTVALALRDIEAERLMRKNYCKNLTILDESKVLFLMKTLDVLMDKPIAVGFAVLELAKLKMYSLHYDTFKKYYGDRIECAYTDTDSLIYKITTQDLTADLKHFSNIMDFSNYPKDHELYSMIHCKAIGYLKDEMGGKAIHEFIGLRPKLYAIKTDEAVIKKAKGVPRTVLKKHINFQDYLNCLYDNTIVHNEAARIGSHNHQLQMTKQTKLSISPFEDKRFLLNKTSSLAYGHYMIKY